MTLPGDGVQIQIVCGYSPYSNSKINSGTSYQQQRRFFITEREDLTSPQKKFYDDLIGQLKKWREDGNRLVVCMDTNEDIYKKSIGQSLTSIEGLNMKEFAGEFTGKKIGPTFFRTSNLVVTHACLMPAGFGVGDHRMFIIDFQEPSMVGAAPFRVQRFTSRRLNTKVSSGATQKYVERLEANIAKHCLTEKLSILHT
jgi:hypothetical protein